MAESASTGGETPIETTETATEAEPQESINPAQWTAIKNVLDKVYAHREAE